MPQIYPEVIDKSNVGPRFTQPLFLPVAIEGQAATTGTAVVGTIYAIQRPSDSDVLFGAGSSLANLVKFTINRGISPILAAASVKSASLPTITDRQTIWQSMESDENIRLRMTDSVVESDLAALADSCENAELLQNKQVGIGGRPYGTTKSALLASAAAIASKRFVLVGPGLIDASSPPVNLNGAYASAVMAAKLAVNSDITDDLDLLEVENLTSIETGANGLPTYTRKVVGGSAVNDFEDLLQGGVSPYKNLGSGGVQFTHIRTTWTADGTFDALTTRLIADQVFIDVRDYALAVRALRRPNNQVTRDDLAAGVTGVLLERSSWISPRVQPDGTVGYSVAVMPTPDGRGIIISYTGEIIRNIQTITVDAVLTVPV
jgi:hypothetical protein